MNKDNIDPELVKVVKDNSVKPQVGMKIFVIKNPKIFRAILILLFKLKYKGYPDSTPFS